MTEYELPASAMRSDEPQEITVDGVKLLAKELTGEEYARLVANEMTIVNGQPIPKPTYSAALIKLCVVKPEISDPSAQLKPAFAYRLAAALEHMMGGSDADVKKECGGNCSCSPSRTHKK